MSLGQSMRKLVARFIPKRQPTVTKSSIPFKMPEQEKKVLGPEHTFTTSEWRRRQVRLRMARESRRGNRG